MIGSRILKGAAAVAATMLVLAVPATAQTKESVLVKVKREGTLKVCYAQVTPDSYKDPRTGQWTGVFVDLVNECLENLADGAPAPTPAMTEITVASAARPASEPAAARHIAGFTARTTVPASISVSAAGCSRWGSRASTESVTEASLPGTESRPWGLSTTTTHASS